MKIIFIGKADGLAEALVERMTQEGNDVYLLSDEDFPRKSRHAFRHRFYHRPRKGESFEKLLQSISPDCVVFAGNHYLGHVDGEKADEDVTLLSQSLRAIATSSQTKFVLLSSTEVYGNTKGKADESAASAAVCERGMHFMREERLLDIYRRSRGIDSVILRASQLYSSHPHEGADDFLSRSFFAATQGQTCMVDELFQPLHVLDFVDAIKRVIDAGDECVYNVCGDEELFAKRLNQLICHEEKIQGHTVYWEKPDCITLGDDSRIRQELGWSPFRSLERQLQGGEITYKRAPGKHQREKKRIIPTPVRQLVENVLLFAVFLALDYLCGSHELFSQINWMMIYVILISIAYNIYQSAVAAVLASVSYLSAQFMSGLELASFYSYAGSILAVMEFVFLGLVVSYTTNRLRENIRSLRMDKEMLEEEYEDLKVINDENVLIKNEYEERLLTSKTGFPKLYDMVSRLMVQEPDRILMETMQIIAELVRTDTVAVYQGQAGSPWLRLVAALNDESTLDGKTWNLSDSPHIYDAIMHGELYQGEFGTDEPAIVLPIVIADVPEAVVLIKKLPYESETLYHINLLKTMGLLLRDSMEQALRHEELSREDRYVRGTDVLKPEAFRERVLLAEEKAERSMAEYCVVELIYSGSLAEASTAISKTLRATDCLGLDEAGRLFALLNNTSSDNLGQLQNRLLTCGVGIRSMLGESTSA